jgi:hypothetical protein
MPPVRLRDLACHEILNARVVDKMVNGMERKHLAVGRNQQAAT